MNFPVHFSETPRPCVQKQELALNRQWEEKDLWFGRDVFVSPRWGHMPEMLGLQGVGLPMDSAFPACILPGASVARREPGALGRCVKSRGVRKGQKRQNSPIEWDTLLFPSK